METRASYLVVGSFVLVFLLAIVGLALWLGGQAASEAPVNYRVVFSGSVTGLSVGSPVRYRGINVGRVETIRINPDDVEQVEATVSVEPSTPIKTDTEATIEPQGVTGTAYIQLTGGSNATPMLREVSEDDPPVIEATASALEQVFDTAPDLLAQANLLINRLGLLLSDDNVAQFDRTISNLSTLSETLADEAETAARIINALGDVVASEDEVGESASGLVGDLRELAATLTETLDVLPDRLAKAETTLDSTFTTLESASSEFEQTSQSIRGFTDDLRQPWQDFSNTTLYELNQLVLETRELVATLSRIAKEVERDPASFVLGGSARGFEAP